jgi:hypothetical protein
MVREHPENAFVLFAPEEGRLTEPNAAFLEQPVNEIGECGHRFLEVGNKEESMIIVEAA